MKTTLRSKFNSAVAVLGIAFALTVSANTSAVSLENPLGDSYYSVSPKPKIDMTGIKLNYNKTLKSIYGYSGGSSTFTLTRPDSTTMSFNGNFVMAAGTVTKTGELKYGGVFKFYSNDSAFGFGTYRNGSAKTGLVFGGKISTLGWSESADRVEFGTKNFSGWACAQGWCTQSERLFFNNSDGFANALNSNQNWSRTTNGTAVIPVPAAAWLFGSGLVGMIGVARRKKII